MRTKVILSLVFILVTAVAVPAAPEKPISAKQLLAWVVGGMSPDHVKAQVEKHGIAFQPDNSYLDLLKSAGAAPEILGFLAQAKQSPGAAPASSENDLALQKLVAGAKALGTKNDEAAGKALVAAVQLEPNNADLAFALGGVFKRDEDWEHAAQAYHQATHLSIDFLEAHLALAYACYRLDDAQCAEAESKLVLQRLPNDAEAHKDLGLVDEMKDDNQGAEQEYREAIRLKPDYAARITILAMCSPTATTLPAQSRHTGKL